MGRIKPCGCRRVAVPARKKPQDKQDKKMARRLYLMQRFLDTDCDPNGGLSLPGIAVSNCQAWRGFGAYNADGTLAATPPAFPAAVQTLPIRGRWHLVCVEASDFTWFGDNGFRVPDRDPTQGFDFGLTPAQRTAIRNRIAASEIDVAVNAGDTLRDVLMRILRLNPGIAARAVAFDVQTLWGCLDVRMGGGG